MNDVHRHRLPLNLLWQSIWAATKWNEKIVPVVTDVRQKNFKQTFIICTLSISLEAAADDEK